MTKLEVRESLIKIENLLSSLYETAGQGNTNVEITGPSSALEINYNSIKSPMKDFINAAKTSPEKTQIIKAFQAKWAQETGGKGDFLTWLSQQYGRDDSADPKFSPDLAINNGTGAATFNSDGAYVPEQGEEYVNSNKVM